jgi:HK97 family phage prohead protease
MQLETPMFGSKLTDGGEFVILKEDNDLVIAGYASVDVVDKQNDKITLSAIQEAAQKFMKEERYRNVMITHSNVQVGEVLDEYTNSKGKVLKTGVDETGFFVVIKLRDDIEKAREVARDVRKGRLRSFSIGGQALSKTNKHDSDVGTFKEIDKLELHEITICEEGINPEAKFDIVKEDKTMTEIEKALEEFNEVMTELRKELLVKEEEENVESMDTMPTAQQDKEEMMMEDVEMEDAEEEKADYMSEDYEAGDYGEGMEVKSLNAETLDLSPANIEKAYEAFRAEREEERAYDLVKAQFEARYAAELEGEKARIAKEEFDAAHAVAQLKEEFMALRKSLEEGDATIAKSVEARAEITEDLSRVNEMSWTEAHDLFNKLN